MKSRRCYLRILLAIIAFAIINHALSYAIWAAFPSVWQNPGTSRVWRSMQDPQWKYMPAYSLICGIVFVLVFKCLSPALSHINCLYRRGALFGFKVWLVSGLTNSVYWYISEPITPDIMALNMFSQLAAFVVGGSIASRILGRNNCRTMQGNAVCSEKSPCGEL